MTDVDEPGAAGAPRPPLTFAILGCGGRGQMFADWVARHPRDARLVAVAEPVAERRDLVADRHALPAPARFATADELLARPRLADVVVNSLMDRLHVAAATRALALGYHMILEKPMAVTYEDCVAIDEARRRGDRLVAVCHNMRYLAVYREIKRLLDEGALGEVVSVDQVEGVDPTHQAHSFVRGNWGNEARATFMLLAKSCHDIDILLYLVGRECARVSSFGRLSYFTKAHQPPGAPARCVEGCPVQDRCPYDAVRTYGEGAGYGKWIGLDRQTPEQRRAFLRESPYGRCVYDCDNDVVDHQVVSFEFEGGATGTFTMTAFAPGGRHLRLHGTGGALRADIENRVIELWRYAAPRGAGYGEEGTREVLRVPAQVGVHGGGDDNMIASFVRAVRENDPSLVLTDTAESLRTHTVAFAAELARRQKRVVEIAAFRDDAAGRAALRELGTARA